MIKINNKNVRVSIDRLKPAFIISNDSDQNSTNEGDSSETIVETEIEAKTTSENNDTPGRFSSRSGRNIRFPQRLQAGFR